MPEVTVVNMSWVFRPYSGCIADENYWLTAAGGLLEEMAEGGKLMVMATGNIPAGDPSQSTPVDTYTPLLGRARPGFTVGTAERDGKRWKRHLSSRCRWLDPADDSKYVPDVYADGACRHHSGHWSSVATARASGHVARAALAFLTNSAGPLTRADVDALFASLRVTPHRVLVRPGELPLEWRWRKHPKRYCLI